MFSLLLRHELTLLSRSAVAWFTLTAVPLLVLVALWQGGRATQAQRALQTEILAASLSANEELAVTVAEQIRTGKSTPGHADPRSPSSVGRSLASNYAMLTPAPLGLLAVGQTDILPVYKRVTASAEQSLYHQEEIANPLLLALRSYDYAFFLVYLLPLFVIGLQYDRIAREREAGTLALLQVYGDSMAKLFSIRYGILNAVLYTVVAAATLTGIVAFGGEEAGSATLGLLALALAYQLFWSGLCLYVNTYSGASSRHAAVLVGCWLALVYVVPSLIDTLVQGISPVPSRLVLINEQREASMAASAAGSAVLAKYIEDHPELAGVSREVDLKAMDADRFATAAAVEAAGSDYRRIYGERRGRQRSLSSALRFLAPPFQVYERTLALAGTGEERMASFAEATSAYRQELFDYFSKLAFSGQRLRAEDYAAIPAFAKTDVAPSVDGSLIIDLSWLIVLAAAMSGLAVLRLKGHFVAVERPN